MQPQMHLDAQPSATANPRSSVCSADSFVVIKTRCLPAFLEIDVFSISIFLLTISHVEHGSGVARGHDRVEH